MHDGDLGVVVDRDDIIVGQSGADFVAVYFRPRGQPYIVAKATPVGSPDFRTRAWQIAIGKGPTAWVDRLGRSLTVCITELEAL